MDRRWLGRVLFVGIAGCIWIGLWIGPQRRPMYEVFTFLLPGAGVALLALLWKSQRADSSLVESQKLAKQVQDLAIRQDRMEGKLDRLLSRFDVDPAKHESG